MIITVPVQIYHFEIKIKLSFSGTISILIVLKICNSLEGWLFFHTTICHLRTVPGIWMCSGIQLNKNAKCWLIINAKQTHLALYDHIELRTMAFLHHCMLCMGDRGHTINQVHMFTTEYGPSSVNTCWTWFDTIYFLFHASWLHACYYDFLTFDCCKYFDKAPIRTWCSC